MYGNHHNRNGIHVGVRNSRQQVGGTGSAGRHADANLSGRSCIAVCGECAALFMARQDHLNAGICERLMKIDCGTAGIGETGFDSEAFQSPDCDLSSVEQGLFRYHIVFHNFSSLSIS